MRSRIAVLASGGGTNLQALLDYLDAVGEKRGGDVVLVASDRREAGALARGAAQGIRTAHVAQTGGGAGAPSLDALLRENEVDLVALAGYLRLVPAEVVERYRGHIVNVHPALLPSFGGPGMYGPRVHQAVLDAGVTVSGVTVHFVDQAYDRGPIIAQWPVPVLRTDSPASLAARVLRVEHILYPRAVDAVATGRIALTSDGAVRQAPAAPTPDAAEEGADWTFCLSASTGPRLATEVARALGA
ncbi:MAG: phosphoribosylglycinamide formyltransferase [Gemmatimonadaceae bacterium]